MAVSTQIAVKDLARELGVNDRDLITKAAAAGIVVKSGFDRLEPPQADRVRRLFGRGAAVPARPVDKPVAATPVDAGRTVVRRRARADEELVPEPAPAPVVAPPVVVAVAAPAVVAVVAASSRPSGAVPVATVVATPVATPTLRDDRPRLRKARMADVVSAMEAAARGQEAPVDEVTGERIAPSITDPLPLHPVDAAPLTTVEFAEGGDCAGSDSAATSDSFESSEDTSPVAVAAVEAVATEVGPVEAPVVVPEAAPVSEPVGPAKVETSAKALSIGEIGAALTRDGAPAAQSRVPKLTRMKMPDFLVNIPKPPPRPVVEEKPAAPAPAPAAAAAPVVEAGFDRAGRGMERTSDDSKGGRGRKVIYDRRRDSMTQADGSRVRGKKKGGKGGKMMPVVPVAAASAQKRNLKIEDTVTVSNLAHLMSVKATEVIRKLFDLGILATVNHPLDLETAEIISAEFGFTVENVGFDLDSYLQQPEAAKGTEQARPPVVTVMGHVDHGKTSLLDAIRKTHTATREAGGITQHIGAYVADVAGAKFSDGKDRKVVFLDTPGHEAFSAMRARGAKATDVIVLVVAADDGVMPQTIEAINHGRAAKVPIIVAVNKIDKPGADVEKVRRELADHGVVAEEWGGDAIFCEVSAKSGKGLDKLLEMLALQSEVMDLKANPDVDSRGLVIESRLERGRGPVATLLVQAGTLRKGQYVVSGSQYCKVRAMLDDALRPLDTAGPSTPVEVIGFDHVTSAGDEFYVVADEKKAKAIVEHRLEKQREKDLLKTSKRTLEEMFGQAGEQLQKELNLIIKADVHGSAEALKQALSKIEHDEVKVRVLHAAVGGVTESDINLAATSKAVIIAFNVKPEAKGKRLADDMNVQIRQYSVIYDAIDDVTLLLEGMLTPIIEEHILGHAEVRNLFNVPKLGTIAGCSVLDGAIQRSARMRLFRGKELLWEGEIASLKRFKDDVKEVTIGYECGIGLNGYAKLNVGDQLECFELKKIARKLNPTGQGSRPVATA